MFFGGKKWRFTLHVQSHIFFAVSCWHYECYHSVSFLDLILLLVFRVILRSNLKTLNLIGWQSLSPPLMAVRLQLVNENCFVVFWLSYLCQMPAGWFSQTPPKKCLMLVDGLRILFTQFYMPADWFGNLAWSVEWHSKVEQWHGVK